jgi:hypothetical protein
VNIFGPPVATHDSNKIVVVILGLLAAGAVYFAWLAGQSSGDAAGVVFCLVIALLFGFWAVWAWKRRVVLHPEGLSYSSLFGEKQMRWDNLTQFYYQATKRSVNFIPIGTYYNFRLVDADGQKIRMGTGLSNGADLAQKLLELTQVPLLRRLATQFDSGADVDCGPIRINRQNGIVVKKLFGKRQLAWSEVQSYAIQRGHFYIWRTGEKRTTGPAISSVPNAFALLGLLNIIFKR